MYDAVITFVTKDRNPDGTLVLDDRNEPVVITKVYRLEFESEMFFRAWLVSSHVYNRDFTCPTQLVVSDSGSFDL
jgi:hypothetical protein